ncbi:histidine kinase, partial [Sinorhizobium meliloti]
MMETILGDNASRFMIAAGAVAIGLLCLVAVLRLMRNKPSSPFVRGGKNRQPRLAVLDAAAVDTRRRLVLVRRDDVEHLIMIGGPTDIVIESR